MKVKRFIKKFTPRSLLNFYYYLLPAIGAFWYRFPSKKIIVVGVTGTNGKSTVVNLTTKILEGVGYKVASASSIKFKIGEKEWPNTLKMTMPGRLKLQRFLRQAVDVGCQYAVLEITSEGIKQYRHKFIDFDVAVFTNLTPEHIEAHGGFERYKKAKGELFQATKGVHIMNLDDNNAGYFLKFPAKEKYGYRIGNQETGAKNQELNKNLTIIKAEKIEMRKNRLLFVVHSSKFVIHLLGLFNVYNALAAISVGLSQGVGLTDCSKALSKIDGIPGRMEKIISKPFSVFIDYAFTPNALKQVYQTLKPEGNKNKMVCVLGACGGGRDKWKRPVLGEIAAEYCDKVIITNEDPYDEDPMEIIEQVASGAEKISINQPINQRKSVSIYKILDRREAIRKSLDLAKEGDVVVITGKGSEAWICLKNGKKIPWDDRKTVKEEFSKRE